MRRNNATSSCALCGASKYYLVFKRRVSNGRSASPRRSPPPMPNKIVRCLTCGLVYAISGISTKGAIRQRRAELAASRSGGEERDLRMQARMVLDQIERHKRGGHLLQVGCGAGFFLEEARKRGWTVNGVELRAGAAAETPSTGIERVRASLEEASFRFKMFDAVVVMDVIQRLPFPRAALSEVRRYMKNDGVLYLSAPDIESMWCRLLGSRWWGLNNYHLFYFSRKTALELLDRSGFRTLRVMPFPRVRSFRGWADRLARYSALAAVPARCVSNIPALEKMPLKVSVGDQLGYIAAKARRLETLRDDEETDAKRVAPAHHKVIAVLPAYNAAQTLERTVQDISREAVDEIILVDDGSADETVRIAKKLELSVFRHPRTLGYGANQKTCYDKALERGADIVVMVHPDYQYDPRIIPALIEPIRRGDADAVFGSRMMKGGALEGGMPLWKHNANILLTAFANVVLGTYLTEYHSGFRAYSARALRQIRYRANADGFVFDTEIIVQLLLNRFRIEEIPIRTRYFEEASMIRLWPSVLYGCGFLRALLKYSMHVNGINRFSQFQSAVVRPGPYTAP